MIEQKREQFFAQHDAEPCSHCLKRDEPGSGIGPIIADILFDCYATAESERLERLAKNDAQQDDYDAILRRRNNEIYIRACWLSNTIPDGMPSEHLSRMLSRAA